MQLEDYGWSHTPLSVMKVLTIHDLNKPIEDFLKTERFHIAYFYYNGRYKGFVGLEIPSNKANPASLLYAKCGHPGSFTTEDFDKPVAYWLRKFI